MPGAHRHFDNRYCGASTKVTNQSTVKVNGRLWAVVGDECTHGNGDLIAQVGTTVSIENKNVIVLGDTAACDDALHCPSTVDPQGKSSDVTAY